MATTKKTTTTKGAGAEPAKAKKDTTKKAAAPKDPPAAAAAPPVPPPPPVPAGPSKADLEAALARALAAEKKAADAEKKAADAARLAHDAEKKAADLEKKAYDAEKAAREAKLHMDEVNERLLTTKREVEAATAVIADLRGTAGANAARATSLQDELARVREELGGYKLRCPKCGKNLGEEQYEGITIDRCSGCGGVYFDAGETEQLIQKIGEGQQKPGFWSGLFKRKAKGDTGSGPRPG